MQAAETSFESMVSVAVGNPRPRLIFEHSTYTELAGEDGSWLGQPVPGKHDVRLSGDGLWQLEKHTGCLC